MPATMVPPRAAQRQPPPRSLQQRMTALDRANDVRTRRAELKRDLKAGRVVFLDVVLDPPEWLLTARVFDIALHVPKYGRKKVATIFRHAEVSLTVTFGALSSGRRRALGNALTRTPR